MTRLIHVLFLLLFARANSCAASITATASSAQPEFPAEQAIDGERFSTEAWKGRGGELSWTWTVSFASPHDIGSLLMIMGDHDFVLQNGPKEYTWEISEDGSTWIEAARMPANDRLYRLHRLTKTYRASLARLTVLSVTGEFPTLREVEFYPTPDAAIEFPDWVLAVNMTHDPVLPGHGQEFIPLVRSVPDWRETPAQQIWLKTFSPDFCLIEPRPVAAFLSGSFKDWCEVEREDWRGTQEILHRRTLPVWASCGGAQGLAILAETGVDKPWDCPHCRDPANPKIPIYDHIGHTASKPCGDYSGCIFERGPHQVRPILDEAVFRGLNEEFQTMQSHCGQIMHVPKGWRLIAERGEGGKTKIQGIRLDDFPIYAAQFHIEMAGTPASSQRIMGNFLQLAQEHAAQRRSKERAEKRKAILASMQKVMGSLPGSEKRSALDMKIEKTEDCGTYLRQDITYQSEPGSRVPAYLLIPKTATPATPARALLTLHQTHASGRKAVVGLANSPNDEYGVDLVQRGFVCLAPAYPLLADYAPDLTKLGWSSGTLKAVWDNMRGLDLLATLPYVATNGFGSIGHSLGGHNGLYTAAFDERIQVVVTSCGFDSYYDYKDGNIQGWTSERYMPRLLEYQGKIFPFDFVEVLSAIAPRAIFVSAPKGDTNFKWRSVQRIIEQVSRQYESAEASGKLVVHFPEDVHVFPPALRKESYEFIDKMMK